MPRKKRPDHGELQALRDRVTALENAQKVVAHEQWLTKPVWTLEGLTARAEHCLSQSGGIETIGELLKQRELDLLRIRHLGRTTVKNIHAVLARHGLKLPGKSHY